MPKMSIDKKISIIVGQLMSIQQECIEECDKLIDGGYDPNCNRIIHLDLLSQLIEDFRDRMEEELEL